MPAAKTLLTATQNESAEVFHAFNQHCNAPRIETKSAVATLLRNAYPDFHITEVDEKKASLFDFAATEHALLIFDDESEHFHTRTWKSVGEGIAKKLHPGKLDDDFRFARFQYIWEGKEFIVHYAQWHDAFKNPERVFYVLHPRNESSINKGHCAETDQLLLAAGKWTSQLHDEIFVFDDGYWSKSKELWKSVNGSSWDDVILDPEMKKTLIEDVQGFFDNQQLYAQFAVPWKRGVILHGVPGNGKTVSIKALVSSLYSREDQIPSLYVKSLETSCNTEQHSIRAIFQKAREMAPCLLIFEDLDSLVKDEIRSYFLNEVDGLESNDGILMIGSTNHLSKLDPAIAKRPSRFDRKYHFKLPAEQERILYAEYWRKKLQANESVDFSDELAVVIGKLTEGFSFAYMKELFVMALLSLARGFKGEDFELVDKEEAASADEEKPEEGNAEKKEAVETCTCDTKCATCNKPLPTPAKDLLEAAMEEPEVASKGEEAKKSKMTMPEVDVPDHLAENTLLKVIKYQIRILHSEMDNTTEDRWPSSKKGVRGGSADAKAAAMVKRMRALRARYNS